MKKLYLVDVSSMFFRAYYAIRPLSNSSGLPTNAIYGYLSMMIKLIKDVQPDYMALCYDRPEASFRKDIYPEYKANRSEMPEDLVPQIPYIKKLSDLMGVSSYDKKGFEADDIIGTLAKFGEESKVEVVIISGDKDFVQLINKKVTMHDTMKNKTYDIDSSMEKWGIHPDNFIDYLALTGDSSDNIPGVRGVGPKGAEKLINQYKNLETIYESLDDIKPDGLKKKLTESKENAFLSKDLVTIRTSVELSANLSEMILKPLQKDKLEVVLDELDFQSFKKKLFSSRDKSEAEKKRVSKEKNNEASGEEARVSKAIPYAEKALGTWLKSIKEIWLLSYEDEILFASGKHIIKYIGQIEELSQLLLKNTNIQWKGYDLKSFWRKIGLTSELEVIWDVQLAAYVLRAGAIKSFAEVYKRYCNDELPDDPVGEDLYEAHIELEDVISKKLKETKMDVILQTLELPLIDILVAMELKGIALDVDFLRKESKGLEKDIKKIENAIHKEAGQEFNISSPKQLSQVLFEKLELPPGKKTKTGFSTDTSVLEKLEGEFPICKNILSYRELTKLKSTYVDALPTMVHTDTGRVHTHFNQALTSTGRLSSLAPNLQNIPIRSERGVRVRRAFIAPEGFSLVSADYSQIELRVLAHITEDQGLQDAFAKGQDIHARAASEIFSVGLDEVTSDMRRKAKAVNFGIAYGQGIFGLAETLKISRGEAKEIIATYFERFSGVKRYMESIVETARDNGYVETLFGRRRYLADINSSRGNLKAFAERAAINAPIQGTASDIMKMSMIALSHQFRDSMLLQVHDEMIFELPKGDGLDQQLSDIKTSMETCVQLNVPMVVNVNVGDNWASL